MTAFEIPVTYAEDGGSAMHGMELHAGSAGETIAVAAGADWRLIGGNVYPGFRALIGAVVSATGVDRGPVPLVLAPAEAKLIERAAGQLGLGVIDYRDADTRHISSNQAIDKYI